RVLAPLAAPEAQGAPAIVYAATRKKAAEVAESLRDHGVTARAYHAGLSDDERAEVQEAWMRDDVRVVVATNAFGMGVDKRDVRLVVHHELPGSAEAYYQEAGRGARRQAGPVRAPVQSRRRAAARVSDYVEWQRRAAAVRARRRGRARAVALDDGLRVRARLPARLPARLLR